MSHPRLFLATRSNESSKKHFRETVERPIAPDEYEQYANQTYDGPIRLWRTPPGNEAKWKGVEPGDYLLFYIGNDRYRYAAKILGKEHNREWSIAAWPEYTEKPGGKSSTEPREYLIILDEPFEIDIDSRRLHLELAGYDSTSPQSFQPLNDRARAAIRDEFSSVPRYLERNRTRPMVWVEKTSLEDKPYKRPGGEYELGTAIFSTQRDAAGRDAYKTMRQAREDDIVLHLRTDVDQLVGVSRIDTPLQDDFSGPPDDSWPPEAREEGGYFRALSDYAALDTPVAIYDDVLDVPTYESTLRTLNKEYQDLFFDKNLEIAQGGYLTWCPEPLVEILTAVDNQLADILSEYGYSLDGAVVPENNGDGAVSADQAGTYDDHKKLVEDIKTRLEEQDQSNWLAEQLTSSIIESWTAMLSGTEVNSELTQREAVQAEQLLALYNDLRDDLEETATAIGSGEINNRDRAETLFIGLFRDLQDRVGLDQSLNSHKFRVLLDKEYTVQDSAVEKDEESLPSDGDGITHHLLGHMASSEVGELFKCTAPADYWYTSLRYGAVSFSDQFRNRWERISQGDVVIFHVSAKAGHPELESYSNGILGVGVIGRTYERGSQDWWIDEHVEGQDFPYIAQFDRMFVTEGASNVDLGTSIGDLASGSRTEELDRRLEQLTADLMAYQRATTLREETTGKAFAAESAFAALVDHDGDPDYGFARHLVETLSDRLVEIPAYNLYDSFEEMISESVFEGLYFADDEADRLRQQITAALQSGQHIIFTGPPGTGKTVIARRVATQLAEAAPQLYTGMEVTTATADWSTFETVGGYMPDANQSAERLKFTPGSILARLRDRQTNQPTNETVVIDEINRADIDKAFGQMLTALTGESVQLPYTTDNGDEIRLVAARHLDRPPRPNEYAIPESWTILATMNTRDKTSLYDLSYAFMRRFAQIRVGAPRFASADVAIDELEQYAAVWSLDGVDTDTIETFGRVWYALNTTQAERSLGPAIMQDMLTFVSKYDEPDSRAYTEAINNYLLPQLEGVRRADRIAGAIANVSGIDQEMVETAAQDVLQIPSLETDG